MGRQHSRRQRLSLHYRRVDGGRRAFALLWRRSERSGGAALAAIYFMFALFWLPRFYTAPYYLGQRVPVYIGVFSGMGSQLIAFAAGVLVWATLAQRDSPRSRVGLAMRWVFGICVRGFGLGHLTDVKDNLLFVPKWLPPGAEFWVIFTGVCFVLAGLAILTGIMDVVAAWLLGLMFLVFNLTILPTFILAHPQNHAAWGGNAYNLAAVGAAENHHIEYEGYEPGDAEVELILPAREDLISGPIPRHAQLKNLQKLGFEILNVDPNGSSVRRSGRSFIEGHLESMVAGVRDDMCEEIGEGRGGTSRRPEN